MNQDREEIEYQVHCDGECVAVTSGGEAGEAEADAWHYARQYAQDGDVKVYQVFKTYVLLGQS